MQTTLRGPGLLQNCPWPPERWAEAEGTEIQSPQLLSQPGPMLLPVFFYPSGFCTQFLLHQSVCYSMKAVEGAVSCVVPDSIHSGQTLHCCGWRNTAGAARLGGGGGCCGHPNGSCCCNHRAGSRVSRGCPPCCLHPHCLVPGQIKGKCCLWRYSVTPPALGHSPNSDQEERTSSR